MREERPAGGSGFSALLVVLVLPAVIWLSGACVRDHLNEQLYQALLQGWGSAGAAYLRENFRLELLCERADWRSEWECQLFHAAGWVQTGAIVAGLLGIALLAFIAERASRAREESAQLPQLFAQVVRVTGVGAAMLGLLLVGLTAGTLTLLTMTYASIVPTGLAFGLLLVGGYAALRAASAALDWSKPLEHFELAQPVSRADAPALWRLVDDVADAVGTAAPDNLLVALEPNCYAVEVPVETPAGKVNGRTLCLSLTLLRLWDPDELRAVLAHELAHFHGEDTRYSREYAPAFRGALEGLETLRSAIGRDARAWAVSPLVPIFAFAVERFALAAAAHSREREFLADATAAAVAGPSATATALVKVSVAASAWGVHLARLVATPDQTPPPASAAVAWLAARLLLDSEAPDWLLMERTAHPVDTHPPLGARLEALETSLEEAWFEAVPPDVPASRLLPDADRIDTVLSERLGLVAEVLRRVRDKMEQQAKGQQRG